jgi:hypothetical protein
MQQQSCFIEEVYDCGLDVSKHQDDNQTEAHPGAAAGRTYADHCPTAEQPEAAAAALAPDAAHNETEPSTSQPAEPDAVASSSAEQSVDPQVQQLLDDCERLKQEGNAAYTRGDYDEALQLYWQVVTPHNFHCGATEVSRQMPSAVASYDTGIVSSTYDVCGLLQCPLSGTAWSRSSCVP